MLTKKQAFQLTKQCENLVYTDKNDLAQLVQLHAELGMCEMEIFVDKKNCQKYATMLRKKGFYCRVIEFKALKHECRLYVSWISDL
jgi:hypothetical protein